MIIYITYNLFPSSFLILLRMMMAELSAAHKKKRERSLARITGQRIDTDNAVVAVAFFFSRTGTGAFVANNHGTTSRC